MPSSLRCLRFPVIYYAFHYAHNAWKVVLPTCIVSATLLRIVLLRSVGADQRPHHCKGKLRIRTTTITIMVDNG